MAAALTTLSPARLAEAQTYTAPDHGASSLLGELQLALHVPSAPQGTSARGSARHRGREAERRRTSIARRRWRDTDRSPRVQTPRPGRQRHGVPVRDEIRRDARRTGAIETLPDMRFAFDGPGALDSYAFTDALAYDVGAGLYVADIARLAGASAPTPSSSAASAASRAISAAAAAGSPKAAVECRQALSASRSRPSSDGTA